MLNVQTNVNLEDINKYCATRVKKMGVVVGTFPEQNARKLAMLKSENNSLTKHKKSKYGIYVKSLRTKDDVTNAEVAYNNVFGTETTPSRNYFKLAFSKKYMEAKNFSFLNAFYKKQVPTEEIYRRLGNLGQANVKRAISDYKTPPNFAETVKEKGFNNPLIHTMQLLRSIRAHPMAGMLEYMNKTTGEVKEI